MAILFYDWVLCIDREVACIWTAAGGLNAGSLVYVLSRFPVMISMVFNTASIFPLSLSILKSVILHRCYAAVLMDDILTLLSRISVGMFSAFRVYAVSGRKVIPTLVVFLLSIVQIITVMVIYSGFTTVEVLPSPFNCGGVVRLSSQWAFSILALLNILEIILTRVSIDEVNEQESFVVFFIDPISSILTCRFILNLRQVDHSRMPSTMPSGGEVQFSAQNSRSTLPRFIAPFGEPLHAAKAGLEEGYELEDVGEDSGSTHDSSGMRGGVDISI
ncbi:hypothetical protein V8D89_002946 [Ganoderma adspersum]